MPNAGRIRECIMRTNEKVLGFNVDAYTARLIGRENVSKLEGAVLEIVKNAYDADAHNVYIIANTMQIPRIVFISWIMVLEWKNKSSRIIG